MLYCLYCSIVDSNEYLLSWFKENYSEWEQLRNLFVPHSKPFLHEPRTATTDVVCKEMALIVIWSQCGIFVFMGFAILPIGSQFPLLIYGFSQPINILNLLIIRPQTKFLFLFRALSNLAYIPTTVVHDWRMCHDLDPKSYLQCQGHSAHIPKSVSRP